jgi:serine/threonine protein kinase
MPAPAEDRSGVPSEGETLPPAPRPDDPLATQPPAVGDSLPLSSGASGSENACSGTPAPPGYEILGELGRGGMGVVYKARQVNLNRLVALKMILAGGHAGAEERQRFLAEAESIAAIKHPGIVQIHDFGTHEGLPFFALEFCDGGALAARLNGTPLPPREAARVVEQLARAMAAAHEQGIIHRDLKPANVLLTNPSRPAPLPEAERGARHSSSPSPCRGGGGGGGVKPSRRSPTSASLVGSRVAAD